MKKILISLLTLLFSSTLIANEIEFVVTTSAGGPADVTTRQLAKHLENNTDLKFVVINKPGASHNIGYKYIFDTDRPTIFLSGDTIQTNINNTGYPAGITDIVEPIFFLGDYSVALIVHSDSSINSLSEMISTSTIRPILAGHGGIGTIGHQASLTLCKHVLKQCLDVPFKSGAEAFKGILTHTVDSHAAVTYGIGDTIHNTYYKPIVMLSTTPHPMYDIPILPIKYKHLEVKKWVMVFAKNISTQDKVKIVNALKKHDDKYYAQLGLWYTYKDPKTVWRNK